MEIRGEFTFNVPQDLLWDVLQDPRALAMIIPLAMEMKQSAEHQYTGALFFKVGSMAGMFRGKITLDNLVAPTSYDIKVHGTSGIGEVNIDGNMSLETDGEATTMHYYGHATFGGRMASVGSRMIDMAVQNIIQQSFTTLNRYLMVKHAHPKR
jgi:uncharacterized protein